MTDFRLSSHTIRGADGPRLLIVAGVHGDEFEPMIAVRRLIQEISPENLAGEVTLVPVVNEAAFLRGERVADDGFDLARVCPGNSDGSITLQTAHALSMLIRSSDFFIDLHTGGKALSLVPLTGYMLHTEMRVLEAQRGMARAFGLPFIWGTNPALEGRSLSVARDAQIPSIYVEHGGGGAFNSRAVDELVFGCMNVMSFLRMSSGTQPRLNEAIIFEDPRPQSGHLQINYPSPLDGIFEPAVTLGQWVEQEQTIGTVIDPLGDAARKILARESGKLVMLRSNARVRKEDALATIVPIPPLSGETDAG